MIVAWQRFCPRHYGACRLPEYHHHTAGISRLQITLRLRAQLFVCGKPVATVGIETFPAAFRNPAIGNVLDGDHFRARPAHEAVHGNQFLHREGDLQHPPGARIVSSYWAIWKARSRMGF
jgi:hypothetical protein